MKNRFDVIVIGGGHAGCEAALASAKLGCSTLLITMNSSAIGVLPCNPAIGGLAKGQLVKEIDALGGFMGIAADATAIQFRTLNTSKGPAVQSTRAQIDRHAYHELARKTVSEQQNLTVKEALAEEILKGVGGRIDGIKVSSGESYYCTCLIITPGTFLNGLIHIGLEHHAGGRAGEKESSRLSQSLKSLGLSMARLKTGTCPRIDKNSIAFDKLTPQYGDKVIRPFSFINHSIERDQMPCYITYTNEKTHEIIRSNLDRSPLFTGKIKGTGVRYCPSIEDKIHRFSLRLKHHIFLEPEGVHTQDYYPNGISTSLPADVQEKLVYSISGLEDAVITNYGYGIEYDYVDPTQLYPTLETKKVPNLFLAGQINGTTGYEEAASLGLIAGINAALKAKGKAPFTLDRSQAYIGVLIDDLVTKGTKEPYRMFTSRVEYRLLIREDNADQRLTPLAYSLGLAEESRYRAVTNKVSAIRDTMNKVREKGIDKLLRRPDTAYGTLRQLDNDFIAIPDDVAREVEIEIKYEGFIKRQLNEVERMKRIEKMRIPPTVNYSKIDCLSSEIKEKLADIKPMNLGQASRISGVTPAAISILMVHIEKMRRSTAP